MVSRLQVEQLFTIVRSSFEEKCRCSFIEARTISLSRSI
ncbi:hypothetical protein CKA32_002710 [Geitlerinema sp. FC II]|nr:hypothetical protein CKA32_002710 [Geitlerinema sp. FC II]